MGHFIALRARPPSLHYGLASFPPNSQGAVSRGEDKIVVGRQQHQRVTDAELGNHGVNRADLQPGPTTAVAQLCGVDMNLAVRSYERQGRKPVNDVFTCTRAGKPLQQFLQDETCGHDSFATFESVAQYAHLGSSGGLVAAECERPDASIDEQRHRRERSAL